MTSEISYFTPTNKFKLGHTFPLSPSQSFSRPLREHALFVIITTIIMTGILSARCCREETFYSGPRNVDN